MSSKKYKTSVCLISICNNLNNDSNGLVVDLYVKSLQELVMQLLPYFNEYLHGIDFIKVDGETYYGGLDREIDIVMDMLYIEKEKRK